MLPLLSPLQPQERQADTRRSVDLVVFGMTAFYGAIQSVALHQTPQ